MSGTILIADNNAVDREALKNTLGRLTHIYFNDTYCTMRSMTRDEMLITEGNDALSSIHPEDLPYVQAAIKDTISDGDTINLRYRLRCSDCGCLCRRCCRDTLSRYERAYR